MPPPSHSQESSTGTHGGDSNKVDVEALAERVYKLILAEARLDRARGIRRAAE
jgi:hypothetical protein